MAEVRNESEFCNEAAGFRSEHGGTMVRSASVPGVVDAVVFGAAIGRF